jgi:hypothetical protein
MDLPWSILTGWAMTQFLLPAKNLFMAFVEEATETNNGMICSAAAFRRSQPSVNSPMMLAQILHMNQVISFCSARFSAFMINQTHTHSL